MSSGEKKISYAQNAEDVVLARALSDICKGFYIDVGAWHPENESVTKWFYDRDWSGINIEPQEKYIQLLRDERSRDINLQLLISDEPGNHELWIPRYSALASCSQEMMDDKIPDYTGAIKTTVRAERLGAVIQKYAENKEIHFLKIDVEGHELSVLNSIDLRHYRPWIMVIEATSPHDNTPCWNSWEPQLLANHYYFALFDGLNRFYVRRESLDLLPELSVPANCLDTYIPASLIAHFMQSGRHAFANATGLPNDTN